MNKFNVGDTVIYFDKVSGSSDQGIVVNVSSYIGIGWIYGCTFHTMLNPNLIHCCIEASLMTPYEFQILGFQSPFNPHVLTPTSRMFTPGVATYLEQGMGKSHQLGPKCECGAHKVKDSAHAYWCDIAKGNEL
jgi:hypothetical protein